MMQQTNTARSERAAMFVDYENLYSVLTSQSSKNKKTGDYASEILDEVIRYLEEGDDTPTIYGRAYGPFDVLLDTEDSGVPSSLHRMGIDPHYVPSAMQGNTSEIQLTLEVAQFLQERPDVQTIVIVTGDRPYLPLVRTIREQGCRVLVAAVNPPQSTPYAENDLYLDARNLLSQDSREDLLANAPQSGDGHDKPTPGSPFPQRYEQLDNPVARRTIEITEEYFGQYEEVYLTPLLRKLSDTLGPDHDPKALVSELEAAGAARLEKRDGYPYDYTVLIVNDGHPDVQKVRNTRSSTASEPSSMGNGSVSQTDEPDGDAQPSYEEYDEYAMDEAISSDADPDTPDPNESLVSAQETDGTDDSDSLDETSSAEAQ
jgi:hypothetical protein